MYVVFGAAGAVLLVLVAVVLAPLAVPSTALAERWLRPVPGEVARSFSYAQAHHGTSCARAFARILSSMSVTLRTSSTSYPA